MNPRLYLNAIHTFLAPPDEDLRPALKSCGIDPRRLARFTQLALLGAAPLRDQLPPENKIILASPFNSPALFKRSFAALLHDNLPSPLDFMANLHNAAVFHVAQYLGCHGATLFIPADTHTLWHPLLLAINDLLAEPNTHALIGWAYEAPPGVAQTEGSIWWHISHSEQAHLATFKLDPHAQPIPPDDRPFLETIRHTSEQIRQKPRVILPAPIPVCVESI